MPAAVHAAAPLGCSAPTSLPAGVAHARESGQLTPDACGLLRIAQCGAWTGEEDKRLRELQSKLGNRW
eukprot:CAMPEP_0182907460 /NCGR_PEP_ID=MMETSP0034_2-20130328/34501_1 /TAXON_ID=156128 /ORGANISM="Nephroselmis pyriformis, Strain CCMP717" /LENGTH=67 /DNA_ID=CAMNT_0025043387 /DNA_START=174 /DNA_END=375 /DNA_ORIENTATION=-